MVARKNLVLGFLDSGLFVDWRDTTPRPVLQDTNSFALKLYL